MAGIVVGVDGSTGSHQALEWAALMLGSVSTQVVSHASCPVVVVPSKRQPTRPRPPDQDGRDLFTGWVNVPLSPVGEQEAAVAGRRLARHGLLPAVVHTSVQRRAIQTADLALAECDRDWIPVRRSWRLNSNHYGALQGRNKAEVRREIGDQQFRRWRRSYDAAPPPLAPGARYSQFDDPRYAALPPRARPRTESLRDVTARLLPYWYGAVLPDLVAGHCVLVVSHGNTLRALVRHLDGLSEAEVGELEIATGRPRVYELDSDLRPVVRGGSSLDGRAAPQAGAVSS